MLVRKVLIILVFVCSFSYQVGCVYTIPVEDEQIEFFDA